MLTKGGGLYIFTHLKGVSMTHTTISGMCYNTCFSFFFSFSIVSPLLRGEFFSLNFLLGVGDVHPPNWTWRSPLIWLSAGEPIGRSSSWSIRPDLNKRSMPKDLIHPLATARLASTTTQNTSGIIIIIDGKTS